MERKLQCGVRQWLKIQTRNFFPGKAQSCLRSQMNCAAVSLNVVQMASRQVVLSIKGKQPGMFSISSCSAGAASGRLNAFLRKLLRVLRYAPRVLVTNKLKSYSVAKVQISSDLGQKLGRVSAFEFTRNPSKHAAGIFTLEHA
jgi:hypothetical protein